VSEAWRDRAVAASLLWTAFEFYEVGELRQPKEPPIMIHRLIMLRAFLERSSPLPFALGVHDALNGLLPHHSGPYLLGIINPHHDTPSVSAA